MIINMVLWLILPSYLTFTNKRLCVNIAGSISNEISRAAYKCLDSSTGRNANANHEVVFKVLVVGLAFFLCQFHQEYQDALLSIIFQVLESCITN